MKKYFYLFIHLFIITIGAFIHSYFNLGDYDYIFGFLVGSIAITLFRFYWEVD